LEGYYRKETIIYLSLRVTTCVVCLRQGAHYLTLDLVKQK